MVNQRNVSEDGHAGRFIRLAGVCALIWATTMVGQENPATKSPVEEFKAFLAHRPIVESFTFKRRVGPGGGATKEFQTIALLHGRWDSELRFYLQSIRSSDQIDKLADPNHIFLGRIDDLRWKTSGERLVSEVLTPEHQAWADWPVDAASGMREILNDALNMSLPRVRPGSVVWTGDELDAETEGGTLHGRLQVEGGLPKSITYEGRGRYIKIGEHFRIDYSYSTTPPSPIPDHAQVYKISGGTSRLAIEIFVDELKLSEEHLAASLFDGQRFVVPRWDTLLTYSNNTAYYHPPGIQSKELIAVEKMSKTAVIKPSFRMWYFIVLGFLIFLPVLWLAGRKLTKTSGHNSATT